MLTDEFKKLTGFKPSFDDYSIIERDYYHFSGTKQEFCEEWLKEGGIQRLYDEKVEKIKELWDKNIELREKYDKLEKQFDEALCWKPSERTGTSMSQHDYLELKESCKAIDGVLTEDEAKEHIHEITGMDIERIELIANVKTYEVNIHHKLRVKDTYERQPVYFATDYNYFRFDCNGWQWEIVNGNLIQYND